MEAQTLNQRGNKKEECVYFIFLNTQKQLVELEDELVPIFRKIGRLSRAIEARCEEFGI